MVLVYVIDCSDHCMQLYKPSFNKLKLQCQYNYTEPIPLTELED